MLAALHTERHAKVVEEICFLARLVAGKSKESRSSDSHRTADWSAISTAVVGSLTPSTSACCTQLSLMYQEVEAGAVSSVYTWACA